MHADRLVDRLRAIRETRIRVHVLIEALGSGEPSGWVRAIDDIIARAHQADIDAMLALDCVRQAAGAPELPYETRKALYEAASALQRPAIARLFLTSSPAIPLPVTLVKQLGPERPLRPTSRPLTLGERRALARTHDREQLLLLIRDPHPMVVSIVLDNPQLTEPDVVRLAATRPAVPASLVAIARHTKWSVRHAVKRALVLNPSLPLADAIRLVTTLREGELAEVAADPSLPPLLRAQAAELSGLTRRS